MLMSRFSFFAFLFSLSISPGSSRLGHFDGIFSDDQAEKNSKRVRAKRTAYDNMCNGTVKQNSTLEDVYDDLEKMFEPSKVDVYLHKERNMRPEQCMYTFLDLGANVGHSLGTFIDSGIEICGGKKMKKQPKYNLDENRINEHHKKKMKMIDFGRCFRQKDGVCTGDYFNHPEDYCYYGVEGNPVFTERLQQLQFRTMRSSPRPVRRAYFFTETVAHTVAGPTVLYLDTVSKAQNYWGSTTLEDHPDILKSVDANGEVESAAVHGMTLKTLIRQTLVPKKGAKMMIKIDIEGAEYALLNAAYEEGFICDIIKEKGVQISILFDVHRNIGDSEDRRKFKEVTIVGLQECGVIMWGSMNMWGSMKIGR